MNNQSDDFAQAAEPVDKYERIEGWRITEHELGPHEQAESCDESPVCQHVYRCAPGRQEVAL